MITRQLPKSTASVYFKIDFLIWYAYFIYKLLFRRYRKNKKFIPIIGLGVQNRFYYWARYTRSYVKHFSRNRNKYNNFKFNQFIFLPTKTHRTFIFLKKQAVLLKKRVFLLKKNTDFKKNALMNLSIRSWKFQIFKKRKFKQKRKRTKKHVLKYKFYPYKRTKRKIREINFNAKNRFARIFYFNRKLYASLKNHNRLKQYRFNKCFSNLFKKNWKSVLYSMEFTVKRFLIKSRFVLTETNVMVLIKNGLVFVNGVLELNAGKILRKNDYIQLVVNKNYYYKNRRDLSTIFKLRKKANHRIWKMIRFLNIRNKQIPKNVPKWILGMMFHNQDVPNNLEVDFSSLTSIILFDNLTVKNFPPFFTKFVNFFLMRLYVWKYIV